MKNEKNHLLWHSGLFHNKRQWCWGGNTAHKKLWSDTLSDKSIAFLFNCSESLPVKETSAVHLRHWGVFLWAPRSFSYFSARWSEKGGEAEPTQKATLFPSGSALHPTMNGVLKNITLGTRLFFILHKWAICPGVSSGLLVRCCAGVKLPTSKLEAQGSLCGPLAFSAAPFQTPGRSREKGLELGEDCTVQSLVSGCCQVFVFFGILRPCKACMLRLNKLSIYCREANDFNTLTPPPGSTILPLLLLSKETRGAPAVSSGA